MAIDVMNDVRRFYPGGLVLAALFFKDDIFLKNTSLGFLEVKVSNSKIKKLPRPTDLITIKKLFMK